MTEELDPGVQFILFATAALDHAKAMLTADAMRMPLFGFWEYSNGFQHNSTLAAASHSLEGFNLGKIAEVIIAAAVKGKPKFFAMVTPTVRFSDEDLERFGAQGADAFEKSKWMHAAAAAQEIGPIREFVEQSRIVLCHAIDRDGRRLEAWFRFIPSPKLGGGRNLEFKEYEFAVLPDGDTFIDPIEKLRAKMLRKQ